MLLRAGIPALFLCAMLHRKEYRMEEKEIMIELPEETEKELSNGKGDEDDE